MKRIALFVLEGDEKDGLFNVQTGAEVSCATCKWAVARKFRKLREKWREELSLVCCYNGGSFFSDEDVGLLVTPLHGCVQWEGK